jgi:hypothetical protein
METFGPPSSEINFLDDTWWERRLPYPVDCAFRMDGLVAPLSVYGIAPTLCICHINGCEVVSYPSNAVGYLLESSPLPGMSWQTVTNAPVINGPNCNVTLPMASKSVFFRLRAN